MKLYTVKEAADVLKVIPKTVRRQIREDNLEASMVGNRYRIQKKDLQKFLEKTKEKKFLENTKKADKD